MNGAVPGTPVAISAGADSALVGPFGTPRDYAISSENPATYVYSTPDPFAAGDSLTGAILTSPTLITPILGVAVSGDISACVSTGMVLDAPQIGIATATSITGVGFSSGAGVPDDGVQASLDRNPAGDDNALTFTTKDYGVDGNDWSITYVAPVLATLNIDPAGDENALDFTSAIWGTAGNDTTIEYLDPGDINQTISVDVTASAIVVSLATEGAGTITTTAAELITAYELVSAATDLATVAIDASDTGGADDGSGVVTAMAEASFTGGLGIGPGQSTEATVAIDGDDLTVHLETDAGGVITTTAAELITAWEADAPALAIATVALDTSDTGGDDDGRGIVTVLASADFTSGAGTGVDTAIKGGIYADLTNAKLYIQSGLVGAPVWKIVTSAA
jgi:hypothetical protein